MLSSVDHLHASAGVDDNPEAQQVNHWAEHKYGWALRKGNKTVVELRYLAEEWPLIIFECSDCATLQQIAPLLSARADPSAAATATFRLVNLHSGSVIEPHEFILDMSGGEVSIRDFRVPIQSRWGKCYRHFRNGLYRMFGV